MLAFSALLASFIVITSAIFFGWVGHLATRKWLDFGGD